MRTNLSSQFPIWETNLVDSPEACKEDWREMKVEGWLTPNAISQVESLASQYNIPIL